MSKTVPFAQSTAFSILRSVFSNTSLRLFSGALSYRLPSGFSFDSSLAALCDFFVAAAFDFFSSGDEVEKERAGAKAMAGPEMFTDGVTRLDAMRTALATIVPRMVRRPCV